ncbi:hypothetical protein ACHELY_004333 [Vibrio vulnificus]|nr:hypothetical protein [Vibrio parahaemolyticus]MBM4928336.1 hypothetical protein [Vibrio parahaemolyticus]WMO01679.1 hypothetical protein NI379_06155 [Vibrio parahaemolyticus]WMO01783.1 hypothetical protein NI379_06940 [Vibrio parahaemolyticus]
MRNKVIAGLLLLGSVLTLVASGLLLYRAVYFASLTGNFPSAIIGVLLGVISLVLTFKTLGEAGQDAGNRVAEIKFAKPLCSVIVSFVGSLVAIHYAGLSVAGYLKWLCDALPI